VVHGGEGGGMTANLVRHSIHPSVLIHPPAEDLVRPCAVSRNEQRFPRDLKMRTVVTKTNGEKNGQLFSRVFIFPRRARKTRSFVSPPNSFVTERARSDLRKTLYGDKYTF